MIRVTAPSRLHFGLLSLPGPERWSNHLGEAVLPPRSFGGAGLMSEAPGLQVTFRPAAVWSAEGPLAERALEFSRRVSHALPGVDLRPQRMTIEHAPPEHHGLGTGTQLGMAVARGLVATAELADIPAIELARLVGRGVRSALGLHGFARGGFLVEAGKRQAGEISPLVAQVPIPASWRIVLVLPPWGPGLHSVEEGDAFDRLSAHPLPLAVTEALCRLVLLGMLPALSECDLEGFGEAVYEFNARAGTAFTEVQQGTYANLRTAELIDFLRRQGTRGVGQSSWGPAVFALAGDEDEAQHLRRQLQQRFNFRDPEIVVTRACNHGAAIEEE